MTGLSQAPRRRSSRRLIVALVIVVAVLALVVAADRGVQALAERRVATEVQTALGADQPPAVDLGPWPFLTEVATGRIDRARVQLPEVELPDGNGATATGVDATFFDVRLSDRFTRIVAGRGQVTGMLSYDSVSKLSGMEVSYEAPDRIGVAFSFLLGQETVSGTATGRPVLDAENQALAFEDVEVSVPGSEGDQAVLDAAGRLVLRAIPLSNLPYDLEVTEFAVSETGVRIGATGQDFPIRN